MSCRAAALALALVAVSAGALASCQSAEAECKGGENSVLMQLPPHATHSTRPDPQEELAEMQSQIDELEERLEDVETLQPSLLEEFEGSARRGDDDDSGHRRRKDDDDDKEYTGDLKRARYDLESFAEELNFKIDDLVGGEFCSTKTCYVKGCAVYFGVTTYPGETLHFTVETTEGDFQRADNVVNLTANSDTLAVGCSSHERCGIADGVWALNASSCMQTNGETDGVFQYVTNSSKTVIAVIASSGLRRRCGQVLQATVCFKDNFGLNTLKHDADAMSAHLQSLDAQMAQTQAAVSSNTAAIGENQQALANLTSTVVQINALAQNNAGCINETKQAIQNLSLQVAQIKSQVQQNSDETANHKAALEGFGSQLANVNSSLGSQIAQIEASVQSNTAAVSTNAAQLQEISAKVMELNATIQDLLATTTTSTTSPAPVPLEGRPGRTLLVSAENGVFLCSIPEVGASGLPLDVSGSSCKNLAPAAAAESSKPFRTIQAPNGDFVMAEKGKNRIQRCDLEGTCQAVAPPAGVTFQEPQAVQLDEAGRYIIGDSGGVWRCDEATCERLGPPPVVPYPEYPDYTMSALDHAIDVRMMGSDILVSALNGDRVQKCRAEVNGTCDLVLLVQMYCAVPSQDGYYFCDPAFGGTNDDSIKFCPFEDAPCQDANLEVVAGGVRGSGPENLFLPHDVLIEGSGNLIVADSFQNNRIQRCPPKQNPGTPEACETLFVGLSFPTGLAYSTTQLLPQAVSAGATAIPVADESLFVVGDAVVVADTLREEKVVIAVSSGSLTLDSALANSYSTAGSITVIAQGAR